jgi:GxxExxY protein
VEDFVEKTDNELTEAIIGSAIDVHRASGPGLLESCYEACLAWELHSRGIEFQRQVALAIVYKGHVVDCAYRVDLLVENRVIIKVKAVEQVKDVHRAQLLTYLKLANKRIGLILNFNVELLKHGIDRMVL